MMSKGDQFMAVLQLAAREAGTKLQTDNAEMLRYAAERSAYLSTLVGDPGFDKAVKAEADAALLKAGIVATHQGDGTDARILGIIQGGLFLLAGTPA